MEYIFGYGSLIERESRRRTSPKAIDAFPVIINGIRRFWGARTGVPGFSTTYLGANISDTSICNGVIYWVNEEDIANTDKRERNYERVPVDMNRLEWLCSEPSKPIERVWIYISKDSPPNEKYPIIQSYVDICLNGCLQIEDEFPVANDRFFLDMFLNSTEGWSKHWVNDRIYPRAPHRCTPNAIKIDGLLVNRFPDEFAAIRIE